MKKILSRRLFIQKSVTAGIGFSALGNLAAFPGAASPGMKLGLVTYQWAKDWDLPTIIANCEKTGIHGVELRTQHAHEVEINLNTVQRADVKKRFADSNVTCIGYGSNFEFHSPDPKQLRENIEQTKAYIILCKDIGATGIKVKPNDLPDDVPVEKTIEQIATSLDEVAKFAQDYGQLIRVEVHGRHTAELPNMKAIFEQVTQPNVKMCWNSNSQDLLSPGLEGNFNMVKNWLGDTLHTHNFGGGEYPHQQLFDLLTGIQYTGWILLEESTDPKDKITALRERRA
ncbi:MAG: TIM barrel protein, partial [Ginsengibacter sp.]